MTERKFPDGFYWGAATAAYQVEGGIETVDWARAAVEGRVPVCGRACDHYHRFKEDFALAKSIGQNAHRFSVEWARIEPEEGKFNIGAIQHYREVLLALKAEGLEPFITLWHFTIPVWFAERGGFERPDAAQIFARYAAYVVAELGDLCDHFSTMNEPNVYASNGWLRGSWPPFKRFTLTELVSITNSVREHEAKASRGFGSLFLYFRVMKNLAKAHNAAYCAIKKISPATDVSFVQHVIVFDAVDSLWYQLRAKIANYFWTYRFTNRVAKYCDSIGLNYYFYTQFGDTREWRKTDMNWNYAPDHIYDALIMLSRYKKPLFVSEGGLADAADTGRAEYITRQVSGVWRALQAGVDVRGHFYWSLMDNYEWALGFEKRFGLIAINYETLERTIRPSAYVYKKICEENRVIE